MYREESHFDLNYPHDGREPSADMLFRIETFIKEKQAERGRDLGSHEMTSCEFGLNLLALMVRRHLLQIISSGKRFSERELAILNRQIIECFSLADESKQPRSDKELGIVCHLIQKKIYDQLHPSGESIASRRPFSEERPLFLEYDDDREFVDLLQLLASVATFRSMRETLKEFQRLQSDE